MFRHGQPHRLLGGAIHYFRVHPSQWADRLARLAAMGANTLDTYIAWNFHQPTRSAADFSGWRDLPRFIELAAEQGLDVLVRPGPYICAEWDNGGFPAWLSGTPGIQLRSRQDQYQRAVEHWFDRLLPLLTPLQASNGGPIVAFQAENEYGSFGDDAEYMRWTRQALLERGVTELIFSADGANDFYLDGGAIPELLATGTLGSRGAEAIETWKRRRPGEHFIAAEFWNGWFDHWGEEHHHRSASEATAEAAEILDGGGSVCLYIAHGGTNFGLNAGANFDRVLQPTVTSYDSDAPIAEDGALTEKFHAMRELFGRFAGQELPELSPELLAPNQVLPAGELPVIAGAALPELLRELPLTSSSPAPLSFEQLDCAQGLVLYRAEPILPAGKFTLRISGLHDRAYVWLDGIPMGCLAGTEHEPLELEGRGEAAVLEVLVENQGRINYGHLLGQGKGLSGVLINQRLTSGWQHATLPLAEWDEAQLEALHHSGTPREPEGPGFSRAELELDEPRDSHLELPGFGKGFLWVNGFLLGRYWQLGPQKSLYLPAGLLRSGLNVFTVLELEHSGSQLRLLEQPELG
nr:beta-galactosidase [Psychromicrobium silvestre]